MSRAPRVPKTPPADLPDVNTIMASYCPPRTREELVDKWANFGITAAVLDEALSAYEEPPELGAHNIRVRKRINQENDRLTALLKTLRNEWSSLDEHAKSIGRQVRTVRDEEGSSHSVDQLLEAAAGANAAVLAQLDAAGVVDAPRESMNRLQSLVTAVQMFWADTPDDEKSRITWTARNVKAVGSGWFSSVEAFLLLLEEHHSSTYFGQGNASGGRWSRGRQKGEPTVVDIDIIRQAGSVLRKYFRRAWSGQTARAKPPTKAEQLLYDVVHLVDPDVEFTNIRSAL